MSQSSPAEHRPVALEFCIGIPPSFSVTTLANLQSNVRSGLSWANTHASDMIRRKHADGSLPRNDARATRAYRSKVMLEMLNHRSRWLTPAMNCVFDSAADMRKDTVTPTLFASYLKHLDPLPPDAAGLDRVLQRTADRVLRAPPDSVTAIGYCVTVAYFTYDPQLEVVRVALQVFTVALRATQHVVMESVPSGSLFAGMVTRPVEMVKVEPDFSVTQYAWNNRVFEGVKVDIEEELNRLARNNVRE